jgi:ABC-type antimicrobial peptide transport system permease subunit
MTLFKLAFNSFIHYFKANLLVAIGIAISTAVLTGALIIGDSVTFSLEQSTFYRLGNTKYLVSTLDRYFRSQLAGELAVKGGFKVAPALILDGMAASEGGENRVNKVQITGIDDHFVEISQSVIYQKLKGNEVVISENLAEKLKLKKGDSFLARIKKASLIPLNAPFVSDAETSVSFQAIVKEIADQHTLGLFNLKNSQTAPYNLFLSLSKLNELMKFTGKANYLLVSETKLNNQQISSLLDQCFTAEDAGLKVKEIPLTGEKEITSERVFIDDQIIKAFTPFKESHPILTYFANSLEYNGQKTPYSFISTIDNNTLKDNEIIINNWVATDLNIKSGDSLTVKYYQIGPLRQLIEKGAQFVVKEIVRIEGKYSDKDLMPFLPGMSDAGNCRDWEAGVPIKLESIRDKDEAYWKQYKGTPKAFVSLKKAHQLWANRFGNFTAIRIADKNFSDKQYRSLFSASIKPANLGVTLAAVRDNGLKAARNGVDFSQLFLGLSFFLLVAALILTALLLLLNLESRQPQIGTLLMLGFTRNQIRNLLLFEGMIVAMVGALLGLLIAVFYTKLIFLALNSLWWDVVRMSVLEIFIKESTLLSGLLISLLFSVLTIYISVNRSFKRQTIELQRQQDREQKPIQATIKKWLMAVSLLVAFGLVAYQAFVSGQGGTTLFFLSGGLLLIGLLLLADYSLGRNRKMVDENFSVAALNRRNRSQNRSRSLTIVILFALGTFLVVSTGANRQGLLSGAEQKSSGTGGFQFFAETSIPVLYSLNDKNRRLSEGLSSAFSVAQFSRIDGDDASCLNLNRVSNPAILGADPLMLNGRFSFAAGSADIKDKNFWAALDDPFKGGVIPAVADQTVIQWGLGLNIGDTLKYRNERGDTLRLKLIAGLSPSVFQGYVLISNNNFLKNFPTSSGSNLFLIDVPKADEQKTAEELQSTFRDYGWEMSSSAKRLMEFNSVTNTYLSIFLALGALGLILGTVGLAVVLARTILERKKEFATMLSLGFTRTQIISLLIEEYVVLLVYGLLIGFISAVVAVLPNFLNPGNEVSFLTILLIVLVILLNGIIWIIMLSWFGLRQKKLSNAI